MAAGYIEDRWLTKRPDPETGKRRRTTRYGVGKRYRVAGIPGVRDLSFSALEDAKQWRATAQTNARRGEHIDPRDGAILLSEYIETHWWPARTDPPSTREALRSRVWGHIIPYLGRLPLSAIGVETLRVWVADASKRMGVISVRVAWTTLSGILQTAVDEGRIPKNHAKSRSITLPKVPEKKARAWTADRVAAVRAGLPERYRIMVDIGAGAGLRQGEVFGLSPDDVDHEAGVIHVRRQVLSVRSRLYYSLPKGARERDVPAAPELLRRIEEHVKAFPPGVVDLPWGDPGAPENEVQARQRRPQAHRLLVTSTLGNGISRNTWNTWAWKPALVKAGLIAPLPEGQGRRRTWEESRALGFHSMRHTFASTMLQAGESIITLAQWLGHRDPGFTLRTYTHFLPEAGSRGVPAMDRWLTDSEPNSPQTPQG